MLLNFLSLPDLVRLLVLGAVLSVSNPSIGADADAKGPWHEVGVSYREFDDPERSNWAGTGPRRIRVTLWYPCEAGGGTPVVVDQEGQQQLILHGEGEIARFRERHPLVLVSPGSGENAAQLFWLGHVLAQKGYIVAAFNHSGTDEEELHRQRPTLTDFFGWERARDLSVVLERLIVDLVLAERIDQSRLGAAGFSLGGTTALWTAGARLDLEMLRLDSPPPPPSIAGNIADLITFAQNDPVARQSVARANNAYKDPRIKAVFVLAPAMGAGFTAAGLQSVDVPVRIVVGDADSVAPPETNARHFAAHIPTAELQVVSGERGHYLRTIPAEQRREELREVAEMALAFFEERGR